MYFNMRRCGIYKIIYVAKSIRISVRKGDDFLKKYVRVVAVLIVLSFCGGLHAKAAEAAEITGLWKTYNKDKTKVYHTLRVYSDRNVTYGAHMETYVNRVLKDYTHQMYSGIGDKYMQGGTVSCKIGDDITVNTWTVK